MRVGVAAFVVVGLAVAVVVADPGPAHRVRTPLFGSSGGNVNDMSKRFCCSGTLGALVADTAGTEYVLSNNHVLGRADQAISGEDVSQPGLIDNNCRVATVVADFTAAAPLGSNVDAAIAAVRPGLMSGAGEILDLGVPSSVLDDPAVGMAVAKSGRTTGTTQGVISSINTDVNVQYQSGCGQGKKFVVGYTDQVVVTSSSFSAGGDSGSLIVTNDTAHNPVALLYAGSSTTTIGNPIGEVLTKLGARIGSTLSFNVSGASSLTSAQGSTLTSDEMTRGRRAKEAHAARLMADPAVFGVGVGEDPNEPGRAALVVYVAHGRGRGLARRFDGVATRIVETDPITAFGWNERLGGSCK
jgi:Peptidase family S64